MQKQTNETLSADYYIITNITVIIVMTEQQRSTDDDGLMSELCCQVKWSEAMLIFRGVNDSAMIDK